MGEDIFDEWYVHSPTERVYRPSNYPGPIAVDATIDPSAIVLDGTSDPMLSVSLMESYFKDVDITHWMPLPKPPKD